jgi:hypothetical protein
MNDTRPIDLWMLFIELGILVLMVGGILWGIPSWLAERREQKALRIRLAGLSESGALALKKLILKGRNLDEPSAGELSKFPTPIVERDPTMGYRVLPEYKKIVAKWAQD